MRVLRMAALTVAALIVGGTGTAVASEKAPAAACTGVLQMTQTFSQPSYTPDQGVSVTVTAVNCTGRTLTTHLMPYGQWADAAGARGPGCVVIDPLWLPVTIAPGGTYSTSFGYAHVAGCVASQFEAFDSFYDADGTLLASGTASVPIVPAVACRVAYANQGEWPGGFSAALAITNSGKVANDGWTLTFRFGGDQRVGNVWGASAAQTGQSVTLTNLPWDAAIAPGATINVVGMTGTWTASDLAPGSFAVNGVACT